MKIAGDEAIPFGWTRRISERAMIGAQKLVSSLIELHGSMSGYRVCCRGTENDVCVDFITAGILLCAKTGETRNLGSNPL